MRTVLLISLIGLVLLIGQPALAGIDSVQVWIEGNPIPPASDGKYHWEAIDDTVLTVNGYVAKTLLPSSQRTKVYGPSDRQQLQKRAFEAVGLAQDTGKLDIEAAEAGVAILRSRPDLIRSAEPLSDGSAIIVTYADGSTEHYNLGRREPGTAPLANTVEAYSFITNDGGLILIGANGDYFKALQPGCQKILTALIERERTAPVLYSEWAQICISPELVQLFHVPKAIARIAGR